MSPTAHGGPPPGAPTRDDVTSAATARAYAESVVRRTWDAAAGRGPRDQDVIDLLLVVSELVTNAIRHGGGLAGFDTWAVEDGVRVAVHDRSDIVPPVAYGPGSLPPGHRGSGYGWPLIIRLAREIVIDRRPGGGKTITVFVPVRTASGGR
ncbi:ATP-binding protein [Streptomyces sp. DH24]|nr:ATP-binding protein [Streptomyces sp. DH24]MDG9717914.1 ATP-binding protein [Streptomyces sp. DH24]